MIPKNESNPAKQVRNKSNVSNSLSVKLISLKRFSFPKKLKKIGVGKKSKHINNKKGNILNKNPNPIKM